MDLELLANLSWREALIALVVLLVLYLVLAFLRIRRLKREKNVISTPDSVAAQSVLAAYNAVQEPALSAAPELPAASPEFAFPWNEPPPGVPGQQRMEALEHELDQLRKEVGGLRAEVLLLREEQRRERSQSEVTQNVSPHYSDAMQMAMQGNDAATISLHCSISRAEAELVVALVRNRDVQ